MINNQLDSSEDIKFSVQISIIPAIVATLYLFGTIWHHNDKMTKTLFWGPIIFAIVIGIVLRPNSTVSNNDNSKDENL